MKATVSENNLTRAKEKPMHAIRTIRRLFMLTGQWKRILLFVSVALFLSLGLELVMPLMIERAINDISYTGGLHVNFRALTVDIGIVVLVSILSSLVSAALSRLSALFSLNFEAKLRYEVYSKSLRLPLSDINRYMTGDLMSRTVTDTSVAAKTFTDSLLSLIGSVVVIAGCAVIMFIKCRQIALISIGAAIASTLIVMLYSGILYPKFSAQQAAIGSLTAHIEESVKGFRVCHSMGRKKYNNEQMDALSGDLYKKRVLVYQWQNLLGPIMLLFGNLNFLLIVLFGAKYTLSGLISFGAMQAFILYSRQFMEPVNELGECFLNVQNSLAAAERLFNVMDTPGEVLLTDSREIDVRKDDAVVFEKVTFGYKRNIKVLRNLNLRVRRGETLAVVGATGAGKTTLFKLLLRLYPEYDGRICVFGEDISALPLQKLRETVTVVPQDPMIVPGTLRDNILYGREDASDEEILAAAAECNVLEPIMELENGLNTDIGRQSDSLNSGLKQMICLLRAVMRQSEILVLDEATSSLDPENDERIRCAIARLMRDKTCIVIAHRISSIMGADRIAVLSEGRIAEEGTHTELLKKQSIYYELFKSQYLGKET